MIDFDNDNDQKFYASTYSPAYVWEEFDKGNIGHVDVIVLLKVAGFCNMKNGFCWASNEKLSKACKLSVRSLQRHLKTLINTKLLVVVSNPNGGRSGYRKLTTCWHLDPRQQATSGEFDPRQKCRTPTTKMSHTHDKNVTQYIKEDILERKYSRNSKNGVRRHTQTLTSKKPKHTTSKKADWCSKKINRIATKFRGGPQSKKPNLHQWSLDIEKLQRLDGVPWSSIRETLLWYEKNINEPFMPQAFSGASFRAKYDKILEARSRISKINKEKPRPGHFDHDPCEMGKLCIEDAGR